MIIQVRPEFVGRAKSDLMFSNISFFTCNFFQVSAGTVDSAKQTLEALLRQCNEVQAGEVSSTAKKPF